MKDFVEKNHNYLASYILLRQLNITGIRKIFFSPGSRLTPLILMAKEVFKDDIHSVIDERQAGFISLGAAKSYLKNALICTSGSALSHYYPAVIEAYESNTALLILSADRPQHLQFNGSNQTTDQNNLFNNHVHFFQNIYWTKEVHFPWLLSLANQVARNVKQNKVTHLNIYIDEPLEPIKNSYRIIGKAKYQKWK